MADNTAHFEHRLRPTVEIISRYEENSGKVYVQLKIAVQRKDRVHWLMIDPRDAAHVANALLCLEDEALEQQREAIDAVQAEKRYEELKGGREYTNDRLDNRKLRI